MSILLPPVRRDNDGGPSNPGGKVVRASGVTDGPFTEAKELVGGFMIVAAESYERAVQVAPSSRTCNLEHLHSEPPYAATQRLSLTAGTRRSGPRPGCGRPPS